MVCEVDWTALRGGKETARAKCWTSAETNDAGMAITTRIESAASRHGVDTEKDFAARSARTGD